MISLIFERGDFMIKPELMDLSLLGINGKKKQQFHKKNINNIIDLLYFFPRMYMTYDMKANEGENRCFRAVIHNVRSIVSKTGIPMLIANGTTLERKISILWFHQIYKESEIRSYINKEILVAGKTVYNEQWKEYSITAPSVFREYSGEQGEIIVPVYSKISGMADECLTKCISLALRQFGGLLSTSLPVSLKDQLDVPSIYKSILELHRPSSSHSLIAAKRRIDMESLYYFAVMMKCSAENIAPKTKYIAKKDLMYRYVLSTLSYQLTEDQAKTIKIIKNSMENGYTVHAMVQGDVGSGKSIVAFLLAILMAENGYQTALIVPTAVLAQQHFLDLQSLLQATDIQIELIPSLMTLKKKDRDGLLNRIKTGRSKILIGTHALLSDKIDFNDLALVITDEEHKFGVTQREKLISKDKSEIHYISMSATPIPRSLATVLYGDFTQMHLIQTMPAGRKPVNTAISHSMKGCFKFIQKQINAGRQIYVVCPQIESSDAMAGIASVTELKEKYTAEFGIEQVLALTGKNTKKELDEILEKFKENKASILISTTVIEVGVNVPNANTIIIHNAERFGLASLHQLRGRVGRGGGDSFCILFSNDTENPRLQAMCRTTNGFEIAEIDMQQRGAGDLFGLEQSGVNEYINLAIQYPKEYDAITAYIRGDTSKIES